jgi:ATP-dependent Clp protease ATP-binding subunit ClpA
MRRAIMREVVNPLAEQVIAGELKPGATARMDVNAAGDGLELA